MDGLKVQFNMNSSLFWLPSSSVMSGCWLTKGLGEWLTGPHLDWTLLAASSWFDFISEKMFIRYLGLALLVGLPGVLHGKNNKNVHIFLLKQSKSSNLLLGALQHRVPHSPVALPLWQVDSTPQSNRPTLMEQSWATPATMDEDHQWADGGEQAHVWTANGPVSQNVLVRAVCVCQSAAIDIDGSNTDDASLHIQYPSDKNMSLSSWLHAKGCHIWSSRCVSAAFFCPFSDLCSFFLQKLLMHVLSRLKSHMQSSLIRNTRSCLLQVQDCVMNVKMELEWAHNNSLNVQLESGA